MTILVCLLAGWAGGDGDAPAAKRPARTLPLSVREAVHLSLSHNLDIEVARYQPWIEEQNVLAVLGAWDHVLYASAFRGRGATPGFSSLSGALSLEEDSKVITAGIRKVLPVGLSYDLFYTSNYIRSNNSFLLQNPVYSQSAGIQVTIPLLRGAGPTVNTATLVLARNTRDDSVDAFERTVTDSVFAVIQAYWDLVFAIETRRVNEQSLEVSRRLLEDNRRKFERGLASRLDVTQADAGVAAQQEGLLTAEAEVLNAADRLKRLVDPSLLKEDVAIVPLEAPGTLVGEIDEAVAVRRALEAAHASRPEFRQFRRQLAGQDVILAEARNARLPLLDLTGTARARGTEDALGPAAHEASSLDFYDLEAGLVFEWPLEGAAARADVHRAELERRRLVLQQRNLENQVLVEVREAVRAIQTNEKRVAANRRARELAQEQLDGELARNAQGLSTTFRVLDVQEDLALARTNEIKALIDYHLSRFKLRQVEGLLLEEHGVAIRDNLAPRLSLR